MSDLRDLLDRMNSLAKRGIALNEMAAHNVVEMVEHIEDDDKRQVFFDRSCLELEHERAREEFIAHASSVLDYLDRNRHALSVKGTALMDIALFARLELEQLAEQLIKRSMEPERSGAV